MQTLIHADIFFFVTTIFVALATVFLVIVWVYVMKILDNVKQLTDKARIEGELIIDEVGDLRRKMHGNRKLFSVFQFVRSLMRRYPY